MFKANRHDKKRCIDILAPAFKDNLSIDYLIAGGKRRKQRIEKLMAYSFEVCLQFGEVLLSDDRQACALILYPDQKKTSFQSLLWDLKFVFSCVGLLGLKRVLQREAKIKSLHPKAPFAYLWFIGVDPSSQSQGIGSRLLQEIISDSNRKQRGVYLETSTLKNLPWYQKHGFGIYQELEFSYRLFMLCQNKR